MTLLEDVHAGDKIMILKGLMAGYEAQVIFVNRDEQRLTAAIGIDQIPMAERGKYFFNRKGYVPLTLVEGEFEKYGGRVIY